MFVIANNLCPLKDTESGRVELYEHRNEANLALSDVLEEFPNAEIVEVTLEKVQ